MTSGKLYRSIVQVFVPKYGLESVIVLQTGQGTTIDEDENCVRAGNIVVNELGLLTIYRI